MQTPPERWPAGEAGRHSCPATQGDGRGPGQEPDAWPGRAKTSSSGFRVIPRRCAMSTKSDPRVDAYIAKSAEFARPILCRLRQLVHRACPEAIESIKWN